MSNASDVTPRGLTPAERLQIFIDEVKFAHPIERRMLAAIVRATNEAMDPITDAYPVEGWDNPDDEEAFEAGDLAAIERVAFNLDYVTLELASGRWIRVVNGEGEDYISDYSVSLDSLIGPISDGVW